MEGPGIERNLHLQTEWHAFWYTAEPPSLRDSSIRAYSGYQLDSGHLRHGPKTGRLWSFYDVGRDNPGHRLILW